MITHRRVLQALGGTPEQGCAAEINKCAILQDVAFVVDLGEKRKPE